MSTYTCLPSIDIKIVHIEKASGCYSREECIKQKDEDSSCMLFAQFKEIQLIHINYQLPILYDILP